jgi:hypothetical protein
MDFHHMRSDSGRMGYVNLRLDGACGTLLTRKGTPKRSASSNELLTSGILKSKI